MWHTAKSLSWRPIKHFHAVPFLTADGRRLPICAMILHTVQQYFPVCFICICLEQKKLFFFTLLPRFFQHVMARHQYFRSFCLFFFPSFYLSIFVFVHLCLFLATPTYYWSPAPTFSDLACRPLYNNTGISLFVPLQPYQKQSLDSSAGYMYTLCAR